MIEGTSGFGFMMAAFYIGTAICCAVVGFVAGFAASAIDMWHMMRNNAKNMEDALASPLGDRFKVVHADWMNDPKIQQSYIDYLKSEGL